MQGFYGGDNAALDRTRTELQANRYDPATDTLTWSDGQVRAFEALVQHYEEEILNRRTSGAGMGPAAIPDRATSAASRPSSPGRPGQPRHAGPTTPIPTRTTGRPSRWPATS